MSGIDEDVPRCPMCMKANGISDGPSYWSGRTRNGSIYLISRRFKMDNFGYGDFSVVYSSGFGSSPFTKERLDEITAFSCGWITGHIDEVSPKRKNRFIKNHSFKRGDAFFDVIMMSLVYHFDRYGGGTVVL